MDKASGTLVCFAVKEEAQYFVASAVPGCRVLITGMGTRNAADGVRRALAESRPELVVTAGFAGGLNPQLALGTVVFDADEGLPFIARLRDAGAVPVRCHCADKVVVTVSQKQEMRRATGADAVEMESSLIRKLCREGQIPSATVRVISDAADEDLPLDFNALMTADHRINYAKLAWTVARSPGKIRALMRFQKQTQQAAGKLAEALLHALPG